MGHIFLFFVLFYYYFYYHYFSDSIQWSNAMIWSRFCWRSQHNFFPVKTSWKKAMVKNSKRRGQNQSTRPVVDKAHLTWIEKDHLGDLRPEEDCFLWLTFQKLGKDFQFGQTGWKIHEKSMYIIKMEFQPRLKRQIMWACAMRLFSGKQDDLYYSMGWNWSIFNCNNTCMATYRNQLLKGLVLDGCHIHIALVTLRNCSVCIIQYWPFSSTATIDVKKTIFDLCTDITDCFVAVIEVQLFWPFFILSIKASIKVNWLFCFSKSIKIAIWAFWKTHGVQINYFQIEQERSYDYFLITYITKLHSNFWFRSDTCMPPKRINTFHAT